MNIFWIKVEFEAFTPQFKNNLIKEPGLCFVSADSPAPTESEIGCRMVYDQEDYEDESAMDYRGKATAPVRVQIFPVYSSLLLFKFLGQFGMVLSKWLFLNFKKYLIKNEFTFR